MKSFKEINHEMNDFLFGSHPVRADIFGGFDTSIPQPVDVRQPTVITHREFVGQPIDDDEDGFEEKEEDWE